MADLKISQLNSIVTVVPATDVLPVVQGGTTLKITPKQILESGSPAVLASATITGALTVDTSTLVVDATNDRVGIGTASPAAPLQVKKDGVASGAGWTAIGRFHTVAETKGVDIGYNPGNNNAVLTALSGGVASGFEFWSFDSSWAVRASLNSTGFNINNGNVVMSTSGTGIDFSATANSSGTMTSELLNDYEEGTWTPTAGDAASGGNQATTATAVGRYTKIGRLVTVHFELTDINTTGLTAGYSMNVRGLPFAASGALTQYGTITGAGITFTGFLTCGVYSASGFPIYATSTGGALADIKVSGFASGTADIFGTLTYFV